jgi:hypothetical protein
VSLPNLNDANDSEAKRTSLSDNEDVELETEVIVEEREEGEDLEKTPQRFDSGSTQYYTPVTEHHPNVPLVVIEPNTPRKGDISLNSDQAEVSVRLEVRANSSFPRLVVNNKYQTNESNLYHYTYQGSQFILL